MEVQEEERWSSGEVHSVLEISTRFKIKYPREMKEKMRVLGWGEDEIRGLKAQ